MPARKLFTALIVGVLFLPYKGFTLGLGEIEVNSALNQKLNADIELLSAKPEDTENIIIKLASRKEFIRAGLDRPYSLSDLRFKSEIIDGVPYIKVTSGSPIREPFLNFLVEIDWPNGHLLREYTVLLDPPAFMTQPASTAAPVTSTGEGFRPASSGTTNVVPVVAPSVTAPSSRPQAIDQAPVDQAPVSQPQSTVSPTFVPAPVVQQQAAYTRPPDSYRIKSGDTAWSLADAMRPDQSISIEQMMIAMLRANPESFINENINGLKRGYILRVPDYDQITAINLADARAQVREHAALWRQFQQAKAGGQLVSAMPADDMASSSGAGDSDAVTGNDAYLEIVSAGTGTSTLSTKDPTQMSSKELRSELAIARERVETEKVEKEALQQRISELEQNVDKMKGMLSIEDDQLSDVQALGMPAEGEAVDSELAESSDLQAEQDLQEALESLDTTEVPAEAETESAESDLVVDSSSEETEEPAAEVDAEDTVFLDETSADEKIDESSMAEAEQIEAEADDFTTPSQAPVDRAAADPLTQILNDPMLLAAAGGGLLLIVALIGLIIKRRKAANASPVTSAFDDIEDLVGDSTTDAEVEALAEVEPSVEDLEADISEPPVDDFDTESTMDLDSTEDAIISETEQEAVEEEEPRDDVIAEADVYLAYGIYQQAEELLTQAIADNPERDDYRVKLAETHYASKNTEAFMEVANEIRKNTADENTPEWEKVVVMGQDLCPDETIFQGNMIAGTDTDALTQKAPEMDFDLGHGAAESDNAATDLDLSTGDDALELPDMDEDVTQLRASDEEDTAATESLDELEFDISDAGATEETADTGDEFSLDIDASELDIEIKEEAEDVTSTDEVHDIEDADIDFGLDDTEAATEKAADEEDISLDLTDEATSLGMDLDEDSTEKAADEEEISLDLTDEADSLGMDSDKDSTEEEDFDLSSLDDVDEISTKLDLANAYLDMGDLEGTRGILEEVLNEGNDAQKQEARDLMAKMD
jgi:pilus assembly protein FimV